MARIAVCTVAALVMCLTYTSCSLIQPAPDLRGKWEGELRNGQGAAAGRVMDANRRTVRITFSQDGSHLTGSIEGAFPGQVAGTGEIGSDGTVTFSGTASIGTSSITIRFEGKVDQGRPPQHMDGSLTQEFSIRGDNQNGKWDLCLTRR